MVKSFFTNHHRWIVVVWLVLWAAIYALITFTNHECFRTYCLDLGVYSKALYDYAHLHLCDSSIFLWEPQNLLCDHFDLYLILLSPLSYLFGCYTLLIVQIVAVLLGALGVYRLITTYTDSLALPFVSMTCLLCSFGVFHALAFDYHSNVVAAMLFPWMLYCLRKERYGWTFLFAVLISMAKETMPLWLFFIALALLWDYRKNRTAMWCLLGIMGYAVVYFVVVGGVIMPSLGGSSRGFWRYEWMGKDFGAMASFACQHPWQIVRSFFVNFLSTPDGYGLKKELFVCCMTSGMILLVLKPNYLLMLIPLLAQKMLSSDIGFWGVTNQYNIEIMPVLVVGSFVVLASCSRKSLAMVVGILLLCATLRTSYYTISQPRTKIRKENVCFVDRGHYHQPDFDAAYVRQLMHQIPDDASVCATTFFVPHLAMRDSVYMFPIGLGYNAEYYLLKHRSWCYYEGEEDKIDEMIADKNQWETLATNGDIYLLRKR